MPEVEEKDPIEETTTEEATEAAADAEEEAQQTEAERKEESRLAAELRMARKREADTKAVLDGYKRREDEQRKATLTKEQQLQEERDAFAAENAELKLAGLKSQIAQEFRLTAALAGRLIGTDEESLRADAQELTKFLPAKRVGANTDPARERTGATQTYSREQIADPIFFKANEKEIMQAYKEGRVTR